jgi:hypothetical protein
LKVKEKAIKTNIKEGCSECSKDKEVEERRQRVDKVASLLKDIPYETQKHREDAILSFVKANLSTEEIEHIVAPGRPGYRTEWNKTRGVY